MVVDPANLNTVSTTTREQRLTTAEEAGATAEKTESRADTSQTSEVGAAVVTTLSAASTESNRPVAPADQGADLNRTRNVTDENRTRDNRSVEDQGARSGRQSRVDVVI
ncbi:MAG: hypothetical protein KKE17_09490 [Proteobacteria bacterium]|nr:hypothetical protein [Pseudomonadota bacterium]MBU1710223.1 hypothetical protein [Pseudomonadota bacterium]